MNKQIIILSKSIVQIVVFILVVVGVIGGIWSLWDKWKDREPRLELFVPQYSTGRDIHSNQLGLFMLIRISNSSLKNAYIFPETLSVEVENSGKWYKTSVAWVPDREFLETDFTESQKAIQGVKDVKLLKRFESPIIRYDEPLTRYIAVTHEDETVLEHIDGIRIKIRDCHKKLHEMEVSLKEQRKYDPEYHPDKP